jgi:hypothetical protein
MITITELKLCIEGFGKEFTKQHIMPIIKHSNNPSFEYGISKYPAGISYDFTPPAMAKEITVAAPIFK